jgi:hypothetical protein
MRYVQERDILTEGLQILQTFFFDLIPGSLDFYDQLKKIFFFPHEH